MAKRKPDARDAGGRDEAPDHPYLDFAIDTGFAFLREGDWVPLLIEFHESARLQRRDRESLMETFGRLAWLPEIDRQWAYVPPVFAQLTKTFRGLAELPLAVILLERDHLQALVTSDGWRKTVRRAELGPPVFLSEKLAAAGEFETPEPSTGAGLAPPDNGRRAVIGVIDQGIAFAQARFRNRGGSRIAYLWQQEFIVPFSPTALGNEIRSDEIDQAVKDKHGDEDRVYETLGGLRFDREGYKPLACRRTHGTAVLDIAAGARPDKDVRTMPIIAVDMPERAVGDPAGSTLTPHALWALVYLLSRAEALRKDKSEELAVVANISYGPHEGPHDGTSLFEQYADRLIEEAGKANLPLRVVLAAGNSRQARIHAQVSLPPGKTRSLRWRLQPCGRTPSTLELWWPKHVPLTVTLRSPTGQSIVVSGATPMARVPAIGPLQFAGRQGTPPGSAKSRIVLWIGPTELDPRVAGGHGVAPCGVWEVAIGNEGTALVDVGAWIKRGDTPAGRRLKGRQSYFEATDYRREDEHGFPVMFDASEASCDLRRAGTLSGIATGKETTVVGGYRRSDSRVASYSSIGPHANAQRVERAPSALAWSDESTALPGVRAAGTRSGSVVRISGTSAAAPHVTRWLAQQWIDTGAFPDVANAGLPNPSPPGVAAGDRPFVTGHGLLPPRDD